MRMFRVAGLAGVAAVLMATVASAAVAQTTTSTTASTTTSTSLEPSTTATSLEPTTTTTATSAEESASDLSACQQLFAQPADHSNEVDEITPVGPPVGRSLRVRIALTSGAIISRVHLCVLVRGSRGDQTITTRSWNIGGSDNRVLTVLLPAEPWPGSQVCTQAFMEESFGNPEDPDAPGFFEVQHVDRNCITIPAVASGEGNEGELPFTGPGQGIPLEGAVGLALLGTGAALVRRFRRRVPR
jgi:hypothetical protein